jgi:hypothetical protein
MNPLLNYRLAAYLMWIPRTESCRKDFTVLAYYCSNLRTSLFWISQFWFLSSPKLWATLLFLSWYLYYKRVFGYFEHALKKARWKWINVFFLSARTLSFLWTIFFMRLMIMRVDYWTFLFIHENIQAFWLLNYKLNVIYHPWPDLI